MREEYYISQGLMQSKKIKEQAGITALYCRLSRDDGTECDSNSVANQKKLLTKYAKENGFGNTRFYVDDGYTGTNFNRPGFQKLLEDMEMGYVSAIIVKDMSRLGRDYLQVGYYTDTFFPDHNIRFIAINDCVDSDDGENELAPFRNVMNEMYARDISRKVRSSHRLRGNAGEPLSQPPYGYMKSPENKKQWIIDPEAAQIVKEDEFAEALEKKTNADSIKEKKLIEAELQKAIVRNERVASLYEKLYEDNAEGKVTDEWFMQLSHKYEVERMELKAKIAEYKERLRRLAESNRNKESFISAVRKFMEMKELTPALLHELIDRIEVYETEGTGKNRTQRIMIYYRFVGYIEISGGDSKRNHTAETRKGVAVQYLTA
ncbi:MAG: recombinase family protein [Firmicutes bacterium]|nr:recombinase family protein [Bacillota bacterium]